MRTTLIAVVTCALSAATPLSAEVVQDVCFSTPYKIGRPTTAKFHYNGRAMGEGRDAFADIVERIGELPTGASIVWGPDYSRCGACSGGEPACVPKFLYPDLWQKLETLASQRRLILSSAYPGPLINPVHSDGMDKTEENADGLTIDWSNFHGPETPHNEVLYRINRQYVGRGDEGFQRILAIINQFPNAGHIVLPQYENSGRRFAESQNGDQIRANNAKLREVVPFAARRGELDALLQKRGIRVVFSRGSSPGVVPRTVLDWSSGDRYGGAFVLFGRIVRHDEPRRDAAVTLAWTGYDARQPAWSRQLESTASYTLDGEDMGEGVSGFAKAMEKLGALPEGSVVSVRICLRTKGPFVCPLIYEGHRHFERTGFEPYFGMFPWLIDVAQRSKLDIQWVPDELKSCGDCELNK